MIFFFEIAEPLRLTPRTERIGALHRYIWLWFSVGFIRGGFNQMLNACMRDAEERLTKSTT